MTEPSGRHELPREVAERVVSKHLGPREANPLIPQIGRSYERLIDDFETALRAERERCAKIAETKAEGYRAEASKAEQSSIDAPNFWAIRARAADVIARDIRGNDHDD